MKTIIVFGAIIIIPQIAFAAWWNPFNWSIKKPVITSQVVLTPGANQLGPIGTTSNNSTVDEPKEVGKGVKKEVPKNDKITTKTIRSEKPVEKLVIIHDPKLISENVDLKTKIEKLEAKLAEYQAVHLTNNDLADQIDGLKGKLNQCFADVENLQRQIKDSKSTLTQKEQRKKEIIIQITEIDLEISKVRAGIYDKELCINKGCGNGRESTDSAREQKIRQLDVSKAQLQLELSRL